MDGIGDGLGTGRDVLFNGLTGTSDEGFPTELRYISWKDLFRTCKKCSILIIKT